MERTEEPTIPQEIKDTLNNISYKRGKFLGKGGFAKCYELISTKTNDIYAGKILPKTLLQKQQQRDKLKLEISLHRKLECHKNIVKFCTVFEDDHFVYIVLELCKSKSMMELHKRRKALTEPEARFFVYQILEGLVHLHDRRIVHRDLKLGNLFLNENMIVKIGDFGLATEVKDGERKQTICGTPNYIAPEVLNKKGHGFEVDVWAVGCILYTLLVGKPPFETQTLKETYNRIKTNNYTIPDTINPPAAKLITKLLSANPQSRPIAKSILSDDFFKSGLMPRNLPPSCLTMTPRFDRRSTIHPHNPNNRPALSELRRQAPTQTQPQTVRSHNPFTSDYHEHVKYVQTLVDLLEDLQRNYLCVNSPEGQIPTEVSVDIQAPNLAPFYWVSKWVDYSDKYGLSYQLCDGSAGVLFNDNSRIVLYTDNETVQYIEANGVENFYTLDVYPGALSKKITLLKYFRTYMNENLVQTGQQTKLPEADVYSRLPFLRKWFRAQYAIVLALSNGAVQMNFFQCHSKLIFCPVMQAVTFIDAQKNFHTLNLKDLTNKKYPRKLYRLFQYASKAMGQLQNAING